MRRDIRIVFAGGGTGGHVFPAIYIATYLKKHWGADCQFIGTKRGLENRKVSQEGFLVRHIWISGFKRGIYLSNLIFPLKLLISSIQSRRILSAIRPHLVVGTGGYVAGPVLRQAIKMHIPTAIQEQNSYPGVTTRLLAPKVDCVLLAYQQATAFLGQLKKHRIVGNPVKEGIINADVDKARKYFSIKPNIPVIFIFGGSQGARNINRAIDSILEKGILKNVQLLWQTGKIDFEFYRNKYNQYQQNQIYMTPFIDRMEYAYSVSDFAICRAGAMTISELAAAGLPAILIPLPTAAANHQYKNAKTIAEGGGAQIIEDNQHLSDNLSSAILTMLASPQQVKKMAKNINQFHHHNSLREIAEELSFLIRTDYHQEIKRQQ